MSTVHVFWFLAKVGWQVANPDPAGVYVLHLHGAQNAAVGHACQWCGHDVAWLWDDGHGIWHDDGSVVVMVAIGCRPVVASKMAAGKVVASKMAGVLERCLGKGKLKEAMGGQDQSSRTHHGLQCMMHHVLAYTIATLISNMHTQQATTQQSRCWTMQREPYACFIALGGNELESKSCVHSHPLPTT